MPSAGRLGAITDSVCLKGVTWKGAAGNGGTHRPQLTGAKTYWSLEPLILNNEGTAARGSLTAGRSCGSREGQGVRTLRQNNRKLDQVTLGLPLGSRDSHRWVQSVLSL